MDLTRTLVPYFSFFHYSQLIVVNKNHPIIKNVTFITVAMGRWHGLGTSGSELD